jgi:gliding motility-associated-like protein
VYCQNAAPSPLTAMPTGSNALTWYLSNSAQIGSASPFTPSTTVVGSTTYYVSQTTNLGCESSMASLVVTINPTPIAPTTSSVVYCQNSSAVAISAQALAGHTIKWYNQLLGGTLYSTTPIPSTATVGIQQYFAAQISSLGCEGSRTLMTVTINPTPSAPLVNPISYCQFDNALSLQSTITVGNAQLWYTQAVGGVGVITAPIPSTSVAGTFNFYNTQTNSFGCESPRAQLIVSVNPKPSVPITSNATYCQMQTPASILSLVQASGSLKWYSSLSATSGTSTTPLINTSISGTVNYYVTQTSSFGCESDKSIITITINPKPIKPSFTNNYVYCQGQTPIAIAATASPAHTLNWYTSINGTASSITPSINTAIANTTKYYISQVNSIGCESYKDSILITINPMPTAPSVSNNAYCQFYLATPLTASLAPNCAALWYAAQTGGSPLSSAPIPNTNILGNQSFYVSQISTAGCEGPRAVITTSIVAVPNPLIVSNLTYCQYDTAVQLQASLNGSGLSIRWYNNAIGGTYTTIAPTPNTNIPGIQNYYPCQVNSVGCESQRANLAVTINYRPLVPGVVPVVYCQGDTALALTASSCSNCTLYWWDNLTIASPYVTTPIPSTANAGTKTYYVNQISPQGCVGPKTSLLVTVNPTPLAPIVTNPSICQQNNSTLVSPYVALSANCTYGWYTAAIGGAYSMNVPSVSLVSVGTFVNYVSQINNFGCEGPRDLQAITVLPTPLAPNLSNVNYCQGTSVPSLIFTAGPGNYLTWYTSPNGGNGNTQTPSLNTNIPGISTYYVSQSTTMGCESQRDTVLFQVAPTPPIPVIANSTYCQGATASPLTATAQIGCSLRWYANASGGTPQSATPIPSTINNGTFYFYVSQINAAGCESQRAQIIVTVNPTPMAPITNNYVFCQYDQVTPLTAIGTSGATILWYTQVNGTGSTVVPSYTSTMPNTFNFYVSQISPLGCESAKSLSSVIIHPKPSMPIVANLIYCQGDTIPPLNVQGSSMSNVIKWYASASSILFNTNTLVLSSAIAGTTTYFVSQTSVQGCESDRATFTVSINPKPVLSITQASPISLCAGQSALLTTTTTIGPLTYNWYQSTSGVLGVTTSSYSVNTAGTFFVVGTTTNGCKDTSQLINVSVNPLPSGSIIAKDPIRFCYGKKATLSIVNPNLNFTYQWLYNGLPLSGATDTVYDATNPGLYSVSIKNAFNCIKISNSVLIIVDTLPTVSINLPGSVDACEGTELQLVTNLNPNLSYQWLKNTVLINGAVNNVLNVNTSGNYQVEVVNSYGCKNTSNTTTVTYYPYPSITITKDTFLMPGTFFTLMPSISNYTQLTWQPNTVNLSCFNCLNPAFTVFEPTMLYVVATNTGGCSSVDSIRIRTGCDLSLLFIPNTFTPNGDANNDRFFVSGKGIREVRNIVIYNRWGIKVFENSNFQVNDPLSGWDGNFNGTPLTSDVFTYYVEAICTNGDKISKFGDISLIR